MEAQDLVQLVASALLAPKGLVLDSWHPLQALWAGYGHICRLTTSPSSSQLADAPDTATCRVSLASHLAPLQESRRALDITIPQGAPSCILKLIAPPPATNGVDESHTRKMLSYMVEQHFYTQLAPQMPPEIAVATCLASSDSDPKSPRRLQIGDVAVTAMLLTDLRTAFPVPGERRAQLNQMQTLAVLDWLAGFHGFWWTRLSGLDRKCLILPPLEQLRTSQAGDASVRGVWLNGGYTYLATRRAEYKSLCGDKRSEWSRALCKSGAGGRLSVAEKVARVLAPSLNGTGVLAEYESLIHGDVKPENFFTTVTGDRVAFYDFQYVGLGLGVRDLASFFICVVPRAMLTGSTPVPERLELQIGEKKLLERYQTTIEKISGKSYPQELLLRHWETALVDWLRFQASWGFWGNTEWLEARVRYILGDNRWNNWIDAHATGRRE